MSSVETFRSAWLGPVLIATSSLWLGGSAVSGVAAFAVALLPGGALLASGIGTLLLPQDLRAPRLGAAGALLGTVLAIPSFLWLPLPFAVALLAGSALAFVAVGFGVLGGAPLAGVPGARLSLSAAIGAAIDETLLAGQPLVEPPLAPALRAASISEVREALTTFAARGWLASPASYHREPPPLTDPELEPAVSGRVRYENLKFESGYEPHQGEPARARWLDYRANRTAHARVLRHAGAPRPWLLCVHGSRGGTDRDLPPFRALHDGLGLNLVLPVLPLHGARRYAKGSGDGFVGRYELDLVHAVAQSVWDLRRLVSWMRAQSPPKARNGGAAIGVYGLSLGGYVGALLSSLEPDLACVIAGVPASDLAALARRAATRRRRAEAGTNDLAWHEVATLYSVVSPLELAPLVPVERRCLYAATADRFLMSDQVERLWQHWDRPRLEWCPGGHITSLFSSAARKVVTEFLTDTLLVSPRLHPD